MNLPASSALPPDWIAMIARGVSTIVSACSLDMRPSLMRAVGCVIAPDAQRVTVYLSRPQSRQVIQDIASTGRLAVVFSEPASHRTLQLKAERAQIRSADASDETALARYLTAMEHEIEQVGYGPAFTQAMLAHRLEEVVAISFTPAQAFDQTPGPKAGAALPSPTAKTGSAA
jgi:hypothetical protein